MQKQYFGTDGIRGLVGKPPISPDFMLKLGWAAGKVFASSDCPKILIGKDTRISGYMFESALEAGLSAAGADSLLLGPMPTPAIAYLTRTFRAQAGIVISASHNPHQDNGIKFFSGEGKKLPDQLELEIERYLQEPLNVASSESLGKAKRISDAEGRYIEFCKGTISRHINFKGVKIVLDCAHGATYQVAPQVFRELGAKVDTLGVEPDGLNINLNCGSTRPKRLQEAVLAGSADLGIAFDGDGDRVIMVDHRGEVVDGDELLYIIAAYKKNQQGVVGTQMSNLGLEQAMERLGLEFVRSRVGDRYVMEDLENKGWLLGGESSGHIICRDLNTTGDGIISALQVVQILVKNQCSLSECKLGMTKYPQHMVNVKVNDKQKAMNSRQVNQAVELVSQRLADQGRVLLRPSGTESVIRVMVEGMDEGLVLEMARELAGVVEEASK